MPKISQTSTEVILDDIKVMCLKSENGVKDAYDTIVRVEKRLPSLKGRKCFGVLEGRPESGIYRACVTIVTEDDPKKIGLDIWIIPGGKYMRKKILNWEDDLSCIAKAFNSMVKEFACDKSRPVIEFYKSQKELFCFLPIK